MGLTNVRYCSLFTVLLTYRAVADFSVNTCFEKDIDFGARLRYTYFGGCRKTWDDANKFCKALGQGGQLAELRVRESIDKVQQIAGTARNAWIGLRAVSSYNKEWKWVNGDTFNQDYIDIWPSRERYASASKRLCLAVSAGDPYRLSAKLCYGKQRVACQVPVTTQSRPSCVNWAKEKKECIVKFDNKYESWYDAQSFCSGLGGHLPVTNYDRGREDLKNLAWSLRYSKFVANYWIGARNNVWLWASGETVLNYYWNDKEPSSADENCVELLGNGHWNDERCGNKKTFLCQQDIQTTVSTTTQGMTSKSSPQTTAPMTAPTTETTPVEAVTTGTTRKQIFRETTSIFMTTTAPLLKLLSRTTAPPMGSSESVHALSATFVSTTSAGSTAGSGTQSDEIEEHLAGERKNRKTNSHNMGMYVGIGIACTAILSAILVMLVFMCRSKRRPEGKKYTTEQKAKEWTVSHENKVTCQGDGTYMTSSYIGAQEADEYNYISQGSDTFMRSSYLGAPEAHEYNYISQEDSQPFHMRMLNSRVGVNGRASDRLGTATSCHGDCVEYHTQFVENEFYCPK